MKKYLAEVIGTFILLFVGTGCVVVEQQTGALGLTGIATVWGFVIIALIYAFGDISGTHLNPAVTVAFAIDKRFEWKEVPAYLIAQFIGAISASVLLHFLFPDNKTLGITQPSGTMLQAFTMEMVMTFILMMIILRVSVGRKRERNYGWNCHWRHGLVLSFVWRSHLRNKLKPNPFAGSGYCYRQLSIALDLHSRTISRGAKCSIGSSGFTFGGAPDSLNRF
jgi:glycerol uptake facilitator-like aquaporin